MMSHNFRWVFLPYCLQKQDDNTYVVLNRSYSPVGLNEMGYVKYSDYPVSVPLKGIGPATAARISCDGDPSLDWIYLYNDGCIPTSSPKDMEMYLKRFEILARLQFRRTEG